MDYRFRDTTQAMNNLKNNSGLTLIEILISVVLASVGLLAYAMLTGTVVKKNADSKRSTIAITLAQDKAEEIKDLGVGILLSNANGLDSPAYDSGANTWSATTGGETIDSEGNTGTSGAYYTRTWTISVVGSANYFTDVTVTVTWDSGAETVSLQTLITQ